MNNSVSNCTGFFINKYSSPDVYSYFCELLVIASCYKYVLLVMSPYNLQKNYIYNSYNYNVVFHVLNYYLKFYILTNLLSRIIAAVLQISHGADCEESSVF
jgi:hypothetical protein